MTKLSFLESLPLILTSKKLSLAGRVEKLGFVKRKQFFHLKLELDTALFLLTYLLFYNRCMCAECRLSWV